MLGEGRVLRWVFRSYDNEILVLLRMSALLGPFLVVGFVQKSREIGGVLRRMQDVNEDAVTRMLATGREKTLLQKQRKVSPTAGDWKRTHRRADESDWAGERRKERR